MYLQHWGFDMGKIGIFLVACGALSACGGLVQKQEAVPSEPLSARSLSDISITREGDFVKGTAGAGWSQLELNGNANGVLCSGAGENVANLVVQKPDETGQVNFSAFCVS